MLRTRLSRRLADAYGIQGPEFFVPEPVADYSVLMQGGGYLALYDYFGDQQLGLVYEWPDQLDFTPRRGVYDPSAHTYYDWYFDSNVGQYRMYQAVLPTGGFSEWKPEDVLPNPATHDMNFVSPLIADGTLVWMIDSIEPVWTGSPVTGLHFRLCRAPLGNVVDVTVVGTFEVEDIPAGTSRVTITRPHTWVTQQRYSVMHIESFRAGTTVLLSRWRLMVWTLGGDLLVNTTEVVNHAGKTFASIPHPTQVTQSLIGYDALAGAVSLRQAGDVLPTALWTFPFTRADAIALAPNGAELVATDRAGRRWVRANLNGPFDQATEVVTLAPGANTLAWVGAKP